MIILTIPSLSTEIIKGVGERNKAIIEATTHESGGDVDGDGLEVVEGGSVGGDDEVDGEEENAEDNTETASDATQKDILVEAEVAPSLAINWTVACYICYMQK